jgi:Glycosyl transferases group 1
MTRFLFYVPDPKNPTGGLNVIFDLVQTLKSLGFDTEAISSSPDASYRYMSPEPKIAYVPGIVEPASVKQRALKWGRNIAKVRRNAILDLRKDDVIVVPEYLADWLPSVFPDHKCVLLNQGYYVVANVATSKTWEPKAFVATISMSQACHDMAELMGLTGLYRIPLSLDHDLFAAATDKKNVIAFMPRRREMDVKIVVKLLRDRGNVSDFELRPLDNLNHRDIAKAMGEASIFLSFSELEGFGLPPAEAMSAGCVVVGYTGVGGKEYFDAEVGFPIEDGNIKDYVLCVEAVAGRCRRNDAEIASMRQRASARIRERYGRQSHVDQVKRVFSDLSKSMTN